VQEAEAKVQVVVEADPLQIDDFQEQVVVEAVVEADPSQIDNFVVEQVLVVGG
jgi:hypothetical protein